MEEVPQAGCWEFTVLSSQLLEIAALSIIVKKEKKTKTADNKDKTGPGMKAQPGQGFQPPLLTRNRRVSRPYCLLLKREINTFSKGRENQ